MMRRKFFSLAAKLSAVHLSAIEPSRQCFTRALRTVTVIDQVRRPQAASDLGRQAEAVNREQFVEAFVQ